MHKNLELEISSLKNGENPYIIDKSIVLSRFINSLRIQKKDRNSQKIQSTLCGPIAQMFEYIERTRDRFLQKILQMDKIDNAKAKQILINFLPLLNTVEEIWTDLTSRCLDNKTGKIDTSPFNFDFSTYKGHYIVYKPNGTVKLWIPSRAIFVYGIKLEVAFVAMLKSLCKLERMLEESSSQNKDE